MISRTNNPLFDIITLTTSISCVCEFDELRADTHIFKLRNTNTPVARF